MDSPKYSYPAGLLARAARDVILLRQRDFHLDATACIDLLHPPLHVWGQENIPRHGPCVVTINHYHRPGFGAQWLVLAVSALIPVPVHWVITGELMHWGRLGSIVSRTLLKRIAAIYGFTAMPPMPPRPADLEARAASVREVLRYISSVKGPIIGLAPEGQDSPQGVLVRPASGLGRFGLLLSRAGLWFCPVGAYEEEGCFHVRFGKLYRLSVDTDLPAEEKDERAMQSIMRHIAGLLPAHLRGEFA